MNCLICGEPARDGNWYEPQGLGRFFLCPLHWGEGPVVSLAADGMTLTLYHATGEHQLMPALKPSG